MSPTLGVSVALWVWATSGLAGINVGTGLEFLFLVLPGLVPVVVTVSGVVKVPGVLGVVTGESVEFQGVVTGGLLAFQGWRIHT